MPPRRPAPSRSTGSRSAKDWMSDGYTCRTRHHRHRFNWNCMSGSETSRSIMNRHGTGAAAAAGFGVAFLLVGCALLLQELDLLTLRWSFVLPLIVITAGVAVVLSG